MKYMVLSYGYQEPTPEVQEAWGKWFAAISNKIVDGGSPFAFGKEVTPTGVKDLPLRPDSITGYTMIEAANIDEAVKLMEGCPIIDSMRIYQASPM